MTSLPTLQSLHARVCAASGPDWELAARIVVALLPEQWRADDYDIELGYAVELADGAAFRKVHVPQVTGSIDLALALVERVLPFAWVRLDHWPDDEIGAVAAVTPKPTPNGVFGGKGRSLPLALLAATLAALIAQHTKEPGNGT